jgi:hypothetical protein
MLTASDILKEMMDVGDEQIENIQLSINQIQEQIDDYNEKINAIQDAICSVITDDSTGLLTIYLDSTKFEEIDALFPPVESELGEVYLVYGAGYGTIDWSDGDIAIGATDWEYRQENLVEEEDPENPEGPPLPPDPEYYVRYSYTPGDDTTIDTLVDDFDFANDYLIRPLITGASYGLIPNRDNLSFALSILNANKNKVENTPDVFNDYI